jgi:GNAT superfamily N-acetyltransferase
VEIRAACPNDAAAIVQVHVESWRTTYRGIMPHDLLAAHSYEQREHMWRGILSHPPRSTFVYVAEGPGGRIVGFASGGPTRDADPDYTGELYAIYLLQDHQRHGLGRRLIATVGQQLIQAGMTSLLVWVLAENPSRKFYETLDGEYVYDKQISIDNTQLVEVAYGWRNAHVLVAAAQRG